MLGNPWEGGRSCWAWVSVATGKGQGDRGFTAAAVGGSGPLLTSQLWTRGQDFSAAHPRPYRLDCVQGPGLQWGLELLTGPR